MRVRLKVTSWLHKPCKPSKNLVIAMIHKHSVVVTDEQEAAIDERITCMKDAPSSQIAFERLVRLVWRLRQDDGCPWDKAQTHESITKNMIEALIEFVIGKLCSNNFAVL